MVFLISERVILIVVTPCTLIFFEGLSTKRFVAIFDKEFNID